MDEYKPINVHGILLTAVHDGGLAVQVKNNILILSRIDESLLGLLPTKHSNSVTLKNWTAVTHSQQPAQQCDPD